VEIGGSQSKSSPSKVRVKSSLKNKLKAKWLGMVQVVESLPSKYCQKKKTRADHKWWYIAAFPASGEAGTRAWFEFISWSLSNITRTPLKKKKKKDKNRNE
jgi:hypothetical protein